VAVQKAKVQLCVCFECRHSSQFKATKAIIDRGLLGKLHYGEVDYYHGIGPWYGQFRWNVAKKGGGSSLLTAGCHALDALLLCMGDEVDEVFSCQTHSANRIFKRYEYATTSVTTLKFKNGAVGKCASVVDCFQPYYFHTHLVGSEGSLLDDKFHSNAVPSLNKNRWSKLSMALMDSGDVSDHPYQSQFDAFFESIEKKKPMPLTGLKEAVTTHKVIFAADLSARTSNSRWPGRSCCWKRPVGKRITSTSPTAAAAALGTAPLNSNASGRKRRAVRRKCSERTFIQASRTTWRLFTISS